MIKLTKTLFLALILATSGSIAAAEHPAQSLVIESVNELLEIMRTDGERVREEPQYLKQKLEEIVVPNLDFVSMTKLSIGKYWRRASNEQKKSLVTEFKQFLLNTYASAVNEYKGGEVKFDPFRAEPREDRALVRSTFLQAGSDDIPVVYKLRDKNGWKIYDIEVSQLSLVTNYRSSFSSEIDKNGIDGLIELLKERNGS